MRNKEHRRHDLLPRHFSPSSTACVAATMGISAGQLDGLRAGHIRCTSARRRRGVLVAELRDALRADTPPMPEGPPLLRGIPAVTRRMRQAGAEILAGAI